MLYQPPSQVYRQYIEQGKITESSRQRSILPYLDDIHQYITKPISPLHYITPSFLKPSPPMLSIYLWGNVGQGKTLLMDILIQTCPHDKVKRIHFQKFMEEIHHELSSNQGKPDPLKLIAKNIAATTQLLCLDEFFVSDITDAMILNHLLHNLFRQHIILYTTSNTLPDNLYENGLQRRSFLPAIRLIKKRMHICELSSDQDYRLLKQDKQTYSENLQTLFFELTGKEPPSAGTNITVLGRSLPIEGKANQLLWINSETLLNTPRSQLDYLELSRRFHSLLIDAIPQFNDKMEDQAQRFILLIDIWYDQGLRLFITTNVTLENLYKGTLYKKTFQRTYSRLIEMHSEQYHDHFRSKHQDAK